MTVGAFSLGWHPVDLGPPPRSALLDQPPVVAAGDYVGEYRQWRAAVERDDARLLRKHLDGPQWRPVVPSSLPNVLPVFGGSPGAVEAMTTTLATSGLEAGMDLVRVVNLTGWDVSTSMRLQMASAKRNRARFDEVSGRGSTVDMFGNPERRQLVALLVDALRVSAERGGARQSQQERLELDRIVSFLDGRVTPARAADAIDVALGVAAAPTTLSVDEIRRLRDHAVSVVAQRRATQDRLSDLHADLRALAAFAKDPNLPATEIGAGRLSVRWYDVAMGASTDETEIGRELTARAVLQAFSGAQEQELLIVVGAERLADEVAEALASIAQGGRKRLALVYLAVSPAAQRMLGYAGSPTAVFMRMPNASDAAAAAEFIGREYKFVVNGVSIAAGATDEWSKSYGTSTSRGRTATQSSGSTSGVQGGGLSFGRSFGSSVSRSFERGTSQSSTQGGSRSTTATTSAGRVREYVVEPEVFQQMPDDMALIVVQGTGVLASADNRIRRSRRVSTSVLVVP